MDTVKLEAKWPPDRKSVIDASEFGIYKEPDDGKRHGMMDRASGCLLVLSLIAATAVVLYFTFFDYTIPTATQAPSAGPIVNYAKYVKDKQNRSSVDGLLAAVLGVKIAENYTIVGNGTADDDAIAVKRMDDGRSAAALGRRMRLYPAMPAGPGGGYLSYDSNYWKTGTGRSPRLPDDDDGGGGLFGRRSDFPQLMAYRAPYPPKSVLDVMKYVTGPPHAHGQPPPPEYMTAQESTVRYVPIRPSDAAKRTVPGSKRFRNKFGPPVYLQPPMMAFPDDFMKPPSPDAGYSMGFVDDSNDPASVRLQDPALLSHEGSASVPSHTDVVFHSPSAGVGDISGYPVPVAPSAPKRVKKKKLPKNKKPISVMLDIYPLSDHEREHESELVEDDEQEEHVEVFNSLKNNLQQSDRDNLLFRLNLFPKFTEGGRRMSKSLKRNEQETQDRIIHLTTSKPPLEDVGSDELNEENDEDEKLYEYEYASESKNVENVSKIQSKTQKT